MKFCRVGTCFLFVGLAILEAAAQNRENYRGLLNPQVASDKLPGPATSPRLPLRWQVAAQSARRHRPDTRE